jgi:hypothetical protein
MEETAERERGRVGVIESGLDPHSSLQVPAGTGLLPAEVAVELSGVARIRRAPAGSPGEMKG